MTGGTLGGTGITAPNWPELNAPWESNGSSESWTSAVTAVPWVQRDDAGYRDWVKNLDCPRCGDRMSVTVGPGSYRAAEAPLGELDKVTASCNCKMKHDGRPEKRPRGCGYRGSIQLPVEVRR